MSEEDCQEALSLLLELAKPVEEEGFGYAPALLTVASLYESGFEPGIARNTPQAARCYLALMESQIPCATLGPELLEEAATQLCGLVKACKANLQDTEIRRLEELLQKCEAQRGVAGWLRFAAAEAKRLWTEANEDLEVRERRLQREKTMREVRESQRQEQQQRAQEALQVAEEMRLQGNDAFRQGQLPGNAASKQHLLQAVELYAEAIRTLSRCLETGLAMVPEQAAELTKQRGLLRSNAAQVELSGQRWLEAAALARAALEDDPASLKSQHRLAKAQLGLGDWAEAAATVDQALLGLKSQAASEREAFTVELWKLAEQISEKLPEKVWSASKPEQRKAQDDYEKRLVGWWESPGSTFEIKLEPWGALVFKEDTMKIELMQKSKLRWRGEVEMISGMVLNLSYEPGSDVVVLEFIPPPDMPEKDQWSGPRRFTATRKAPATEAKEEQKPKEEAAPELTPEVPAVELQELPEQKRAAEEEEEAAKTLKALLAEAPKEVFLSGHHADIDGRYLLQPEEAQNQRPVYRRVEQASGERFLWFRGGNWGVTDALNASTLAAPFLARCPDTAPHPLALRRRSRWYVRSGRGQEDVSSLVVAESGEDCAASAAVQAAAGYSDVIAPASTSSPSSLPSWVASADIEQEALELRVLVVGQPGPPISLASLDMSTSERSLRLSMLGQKEVLELELPCGIDILSSPGARWVVVKIMAFFGYPK